MKRTPDALQVGLIGCGEVTEFKHLPALRSVPDVQVVALADLDGTRAGRVAAKYGVPVSYDDHRALIDHPGLEAVGVCLPPESHAAVTLEAIEAGKHVLIEKPVTIDIAEAERLLERSRRASTVVMMGFHMRFHRLVNVGRQHLAAGDLGRVESIHSIWNSPRDDADLPSWRFRRPTGGGALTEIGVHHFDLWRYLLGDEVVEVTSYARTGSRDDENAVVIARLASGALASASLSERTPHECEIKLCGNAARLTLDCHRFDGIALEPIGTVPSRLGRRLERFAATLAQAPRGFALARRGGDYLDSYAGEWRHLTAVVREETELRSTVTDGIEALRIVHSAIESARGN